MHSSRNTHSNPPNDVIECAEYSIYGLKLPRARRRQPPDRPIMAGRNSFGAVPASMTYWIRENFKAAAAFSFGDLTAVKARGETPAQNENRKQTKARMPC